MRTCLILIALLAFGGHGFAQKGDRGKKNPENKNKPHKIHKGSKSIYEMEDEDEDEYDDYQEDREEDFEEVRKENFKEVRKGKQKSVRAKKKIPGRLGFDRESESSKAQQKKDKQAIEKKARQRSDALVQTFKIRNNGAKKKILKACRKYFKALDLLDKDYGMNGNSASYRGGSGQKFQALRREQRKERAKEYLKKKRELGLAYGQELRRVLPGS